VIFVTVGTLHYPFDRLLRAIAELRTDEEIVVQCAAPSDLPEQAHFIQDVPYDQLVSYMREARVVVSHAGVGSVLTALRVGRRPVVMPRLAQHGEAVDDHQLAFARRLAQLGLVTLAEDARTLAQSIDTAESTSVPALGTSALALALRRELDELLGHSR
jgi:UDP-N-acetylglucosamine transferase subunit ALG13